MQKKEMLNSLADLKGNAENMKPFKGKARLVSEIQSSMDFIRSHKVELGLMEKLLKERNRDFKFGLKLESEKYSESSKNA